MKRRTNILVLASLLWITLSNCIDKFDAKLPDGSVGLLVVEGNIIRNSFVTLDEELSNEEILNLNILLNNSLNGLTIQEINLGVIARLKEQAGIHRQVVEFVLNEVSEAIGSQAEDLQIYTSGATNISSIRSFPIRKMPAS